MKRFFMIGYVAETPKSAGFNAGFVLAEWVGFPSLAAVKKEIENGVYLVKDPAIMSISELSESDYQQLSKECKVIQGSGEKK